MDIYRKFFKGECPSCQNIISYMEIKYVAENDRGEMICQCAECENYFTIRCKNPADSAIIDGAFKTECVDYSVKLPSEHLILNAAFQYDGDLFRKSPKFDFKTINLYKCTNCEENIEELAQSKFENEFKEWRQEVGQYICMDISGYGFNAEKSIVKIDLTCSCGTPHSALFYKDHNHLDFSDSDYLLGHITNCIDFDERLDGTISKSDFIEIIRKLIIRWELFFEKVYLIFPYVGHTRSENSDLIDLWTDIISQSHSDKLKIITKTQTLNSFEKAVSANLHDYNILKKYKFTPQSIENAIRNSRFHSKIYCGVNLDYIECLSGSANIARGPTTEQLTFKKYDNYNIFYNRFLKVFHTSKVSDENFSFDKSNKTKDCHVMFDQSNQYKYSKLDKKDLIDNFCR
ncbi:hypothetical protein DP190_01130 [Enterobacter cloacae]|uniref:hypothetical protein n=1 Tax=Enterobacter sp. 148H3 TaxID=3077756 RepID=UPI000DCBA01B|nr:hypothetical protein [Enterobacter sp. 148H3]RAY88715.1 hypothetical protein DP190_01130 [Enterobacter cloacae]